jgi:hypothetical protein
MIGKSIGVVAGVSAFLFLAGEGALSSGHHAEFKHHLSQCLESLFYVMAIFVPAQYWSYNRIKAADNARGLEAVSKMSSTIWLSTNCYISESRCYYATGSFGPLSDRDSPPSPALCSTASDDRSLARLRHNWSSSRAPDGAYVIRTNAASSRAASA